MDSELLAPAVREYLLECRELCQLCSQNGWIDNDTLQFRIECAGTEEALVAVSFVEVVMEGAGCVADRQVRFGKLRLCFDADRRIRSAELA